MLTECEVLILDWLLCIVYCVLLLVIDCMQVPGVFIISIGGSLVLYRPTIESVHSYINDASCKNSNDKRVTWAF